MKIRHYLNNRYSGNYLKYASASSIMGASGLLADLGTSIRWGIHKTPGGYVIRAIQNPTIYLGVPIDTTSSTVSAISVTESEIPERCLWSITLASGGGTLIKNVYNAKYLYTNGTNLYTSTTTGAAGSTLYSTRVWRIATTADHADYHSDLDAENIYRIVASGYSVVDSANQYYASLNAARTRATIFLSHISYAEVKEMVFYELIDKPVYILLELHRDELTDEEIAFYESILADEQYHMDKIRNENPDTYNFLCSIRDEKSDITE